MTHIAVVKVTDQNRAGLVRAALSMYLGERCKYCLRAFETLADLEDAVWAGYHGHGRLAHRACWKAHNPGD